MWNSISTSHSPAISANARQSKVRKLSGVIRIEAAVDCWDTHGLSQDETWQGETGCNIARCGDMHFGGMYFSGLHFGRMYLVWSDVPSLVGCARSLVGCATV